MKDRTKKQILIIFSVINAFILGLGIGLSYSYNFIKNNANNFSEIKSVINDKKAIN